MSPSADDSVKWRQHRVEDLGLAVDLLADAPISQGVAGGIHYLIQKQGALGLGVWWGPGRDLDAWHGFYGPPRKASLGPTRTRTVCGVTAHGQSAEIEAGPDAVGLAPGDDGQLGHVQATQPALVSHALAFEVDGTPVLLEWVVERSALDRWDETRAPFFASVSCDKAGP